MVLIPSLMLPKFNSFLFLHLCPLYLTRADTFTHALYIQLLLIRWGPYCLGWALARFYILACKSKSLSSAETNNISFETPDSWLLDSWRKGAWQVHMLATLSVCKKCTFQEKRAWQLPESATPLFSRYLKANYQGS